MIKVSGLPIQVTKSDLDELFSPYGTIRTADDAVVIEVRDSESTAYVNLEQNESLAVRELSNQIWRDRYLLSLDFMRGDELVIGMRGSGGSGGQNGDRDNQNGSDNKKKKPPATA